MLAAHHKKYIDEIRYKVEDGENEGLTLRAIIQQFQNSIKKQQLQEPGYEFSQYAGNLYTLAEKIKKWVLNQIVYKEENPENVAEAQRTLDRGWGDCDDMSIIVGTLLHWVKQKNPSFPDFYFRIVSLNPDEELEHIYVGIKQGKNHDFFIDLANPDPQKRINHQPKGITRIIDLDPYKIKPLGVYKVKKYKQIAGISKPVSFQYEIVQIKTRPEIINDFANSILNEVDIIDISETGISGFWDSLWGGFKKVVNVVTKPFKAIIKPIKAISKPITGLFSSVPDLLKGAAGSAVDLTKGLMQSGTQLANSAIQQLPGLMQTVPGILQGAGNLTGGIMNSPLGQLGMQAGGMALGGPMGAMAGGMIPQLLGGLTGGGQGGQGGGLLGNLLGGFMGGGQGGQGGGLLGNLLGGFMGGGQQPQQMMQQAQQQADPYSQLYQMMNQNPQMMQQAPQLMQQFSQMPQQMMQQPQQMMPGIFGIASTNTADTLLDEIRKAGVKLTHFETLAIKQKMEDWLHNHKDDFQGAVDEAVKLLSDNKLMQNEQIEKVAKDVIEQVKNQYENLVHQLQLENQSATMQLQQAVNEKQQAIQNMQNPYFNPLAMVQQLPASQVTQYMQAIPGITNPNNIPGVPATNIQGIGKIRSLLKKEKIDARLIQEVKEKVKNRTMDKVKAAKLIKAYNQGKLSLIPSIVKEGNKTEAILKIISKDKNMVSSDVLQFRNWLTKNNMELYNKQDFQHAWKMFTKNKIKGIGFIKSVDEVFNVAEKIHNVVELSADQKIYLAEKYLTPEFKNLPILEGDAVNTLINTTKKARSKVKLGRDGTPYFNYLYWIPNQIKSETKYITLLDIPDNTWTEWNKQAGLSKILPQRTEDEVNLYNNFASNTSFSGSKLFNLRYFFDLLVNKKSADWVKINRNTIMSKLMPNTFSSFNYPSFPYTISGNKTENGQLTVYSIKEVYIPGPWFDYIQNNSDTFDLNIPFKTVVTLDKAPETVKTAIAPPTDNPALQLQYVGTEQAQENFADRLKNLLVTNAVQQGIETVTDEQEKEALKALLPDKIDVLSTTLPGNIIDVAQKLTSLEADKIDRDKAHVIEALKTWEQGGGLDSIKIDELSYPEIKRELMKDLERKTEYQVLKEYLKALDEKLEEKLTVFNDLLKEMQQYKAIAEPILFEREQTEQVNAARKKWLMDNPKYSQQYYLLKQVDKDFVNSLLAHGDFINAEKFLDRINSEEIQDAVDKLFDRYPTVKYAVSDQAFKDLFTDEAQKKIQEKVIDKMYESGKPATAKAIKELGIQGIGILKESFFDIEAWTEPDQMIFPFETHKQKAKLRLLARLLDSKAKKMDISLATLGEMTKDSEVGQAVLKKLNYDYANLLEIANNEFVNILDALKSGQISGFNPSIESQVELFIKWNEETAGRWSLYYLVFLMLWSRLMDLWRLWVKTQLILSLMQDKRVPTFFDAFVMGLDQLGVRYYSYLPTTQSQPQEIKPEKPALQEIIEAVEKISNLSEPEPKIEDLVVNPAQPMQEIMTSTGFPVEPAIPENIFTQEAEIIAIAPPPEQNVLTIDESIVKDKQLILGMANPEIKTLKTNQKIVLDLRDEGINQQIKNDLKAGSWKTVRLAVINALMNNPEKNKNWHVYILMNYATADEFARKRTKIYDHPTDEVAEKYLEGLKFTGWDNYPVWAAFKYQIMKNDKNLYPNEIWGIEIYS